MLFKWLLTWVTGPFSGEKIMLPKIMLGQLDFYVKKKEKLDVSLYITLKNNNSNGKKKPKT